MTIDVAEENPPMNASRARLSCPAEIGSVSKNISGFASLGSKERPTMAMGKTNKLMRNRYKGKAQEAVRRWSSSAFSTTMV